VLNKADRDGADGFFKNLFVLSHAHTRLGWEAPVIKTIATKDQGVDLLFDAILKHAEHGTDQDKKLHLLAEKVLLMIKNQRTKDISIKQIQSDLKQHVSEKNFNLYRYVTKYNK
jgi:LAO/AO transport system kinase